MIDADGESPRKETRQREADIVTLHTERPQQSHAPNRDGINRCCLHGTGYDYDCSDSDNDAGVLRKVVGELLIRYRPK